MQFIGTIENTYIKIHFRKLNAIWISIFVNNHNKFSPKSLVIILENMEKVGIRHSGIYQGLLKYVKKVDPILSKLSLTDLICFIKVLNYWNREKKFSEIYKEVFNLISQKVLFLDSNTQKSMLGDDKMTFSKFKFLLDSLTKCTRVIGDDENIHAVVHDQLVRYSILKFRMFFNRNYQCLWKY